MKKACLVPLLLLSTILAFCIWNSHIMTENSIRWRSQLQQADALAQAEAWPDTMKALTESYLDWSAHQVYLRIVSSHDAIDDAEAMYRRSLAFAATREPNEFRAEISDLRDQLRLLAEMERFTVQNIL